MTFEEANELAYKEPITKTEIDAMMSFNIRFDTEEEFNHKLESVLKGVEDWFLCKRCLNYAKCKMTQAGIAECHYFEEVI